MLAFQLFGSEAHSLLELHLLCSCRFLPLCWSTDLMTLTCFGLETDNLLFPTNLWSYIKWQQLWEVQSAEMPCQIALPLCFPNSNEGQMVVSDRSRDANWWRLTQGSPILFYQSPWRQPVPSGSKSATQRKRLFKERRVWLIVLFLSGSPCSLESPWTKQPERKCTECNEAGASFLFLSLSLSLSLSL